jgi:hypothetical protein
VGDIVAFFLTVLAAYLLSAFIRLCSRKILYHGLRSRQANLMLSQPA